MKEIIFKHTVSTISYLRRIKRYQLSIIFSSFLFQLKELNLKKYNRDDSKMPFLSNASLTNNKSTIKYSSSSSSSVISINKTTINSKHTVRHSTVAVLPTKPKLNIVKKEMNETDSVKKFKIQNRVVAEIPKMEANRCINKILPKPNVVKRNIIQENIANASKTIEIKHNGHMGQNQKVPCKIMPPPKNVGSTKFENKTFNNRDEANKVSEVPVNKRRETVFDRLYKPKSAPKERVTNAQKIKNDTAFRNKILKNAGLLVNSRKTMFEPTEMKITEPTIRRSISAIHLKKLSKNELPNCIHKWSSIGEKLNKIHLAELNEDLNVRKQNESAVKSDRKKSVRFQKGIALNLNAPTGEELQIRLKNWLQKRGKSMDSYHHLQCFGLHHLAQSQKDVLSFKDYDEEDKENIEQADGDNNSYTDNLSDRKDDFAKWRRESCFSDSMNMTKESSLHSEEMPVHYVDELLLGALNDLSELLREVIVFLILAPCSRLTFLSSGFDKVVRELDLKLWGGPQRRRKA